tara:strand:+ start:296 stop:655 length:360 start_codon:yes stop_codon:yes gene_type:complete
MHSDIVSSVKQNIKLLLLTNPGERIMLPDFGVGLKKYLFELDTSNLESEINEKIKKQFKKFMPFLDLKSSVFKKSEEGLITVQIAYKVKPLSFEDKLQLDFLTMGASKSVTLVSRGKVR